jgi:Protein of unknown function (DUF721).
MKRKNTQTLGEALRAFFEENSELYDKILEEKAKNSWSEVLGPMAMKYTTNLYIKNGTMYVQLSSSVLRNELSLSKEKLIESMNKHVGSEVIKKLVLT